MAFGDPDTIGLVWTDALGWHFPENRSPAMTDTTGKMTDTTVQKLRATLLNIQAQAEKGWPLNNDKIAASCRAALSTTQANNPVQGAEPSMRVEGRTAGANPATGATTQADLSNHAEYTPVALGAGTSQPPSVMAGAEVATGYGPCVICGAMDYELSCGGPSICPKCDAGQFDQSTVYSQAKYITKLRDEIAALRSQPAMGLSEEELAEIIYDNVWCNSSHSITGVYDAARAIIDRLTGRSEGR